MAVWMNTMLPDMPATGGLAVPGFVPRIWSTLTTLILFLIACLTSGINWGPKMGCTMIESYCFDDTRVCSCENCFLGSFAASKTVIVAPLFFATSFAAFSIGAS